MDSKNFDDHGNKGPWGRRPGWRDSDMDIEEMLSRGRDKLGFVLSSGGNSPPQFGAKSIALLLFAFLFLLWLVNSVYQVAPEERGVEFVFGRAKPEVSEPGLHFILWPRETVEIVNVEQVRESFASVRDRIKDSSDSLMLSGDQNIVDVDFTVLWRVSDPVAFLVNIADPQNLLRRVSESAMREYVGQSRAEDVRTERRSDLEVTVRDHTQKTLDSYGVGVTIDSVQLERADPPKEVADAFEEVQRAQQDQEKYKQDAQAYANKLLGDARGKSSDIREKAKGYRERVVAEAEGEASRFLAVYAEYVNAKDVTRERLFLETMEHVFRGSNKVLIEEGVSGSGVLPYLPLPGAGVVPASKIERGMK